MSAHAVEYQPTGDWASHPDRHCRGLDPNMFIVERGDQHTLAHVISICDGCPVQKDCAEFAINDASTIGIWGGLSAKQRRAIRRQRRIDDGDATVGPRRGTNLSARCGTPSGYNRHRREGEQPCEMCRLAHNEACRVRVRANRAKARERRAA